MKKSFILLTAFAVFFCGKISATENIDCSWQDDPPCLLIPVGNSNKLNDQISPTYKISKKEMQKHNLIDLPSVLNFVQGTDVAQSGSTGQQASIFVRGTNSNHTLVLLNGVPINDFSTPTGAHDFGQDFMFNVFQIEVYKGSAGAHYGADAIGGAINLVTTVDYQNKINADTNTVNGNYYWKTDNDWDISISGGVHESETQSALAGANETDGVENKTLGINVSKWIGYNLNFTSSLFTRNTFAEIDGHSLDIQEGKWSDNSFFAFQTGLDHFNKFGTSSIKLHTHEHNRDYDDANYESESYFLRGEHKTDNFGFGLDYKHDQSLTKQNHNLGFFGNFSYNIFSYHHRIDEEHDTYKIGFLQPLSDSLTLRGNHSTGYKNATTWTDIEYSDTQEISLDYNNFTTTFFQSDIGDLNTQGLELGYTKDNFRFFASHLDAKKNNSVQLRRPNITLGFLHSIDLENNFSLTTNYKYKGNHLDVHNSNWSTITMPETHLLDLGLTKNWHGIGFTVSTSNVLDYNYQSPHGFSQDGRTFNLSLSSNF
jgi:outer membrane cobalamin receptor